MVKPAIIEAITYHERLKPFNHRFNYKVFLLKFSIYDLPKLKNSFFSLEGLNLFSLHSRDYLDGSDRPLEEKIKEVLYAEGIKAEGDIVLQTIPRILGYGFNPVSFWQVYDKEGKLEAVMAEVNNTFGDRHYYLMQGFTEYKKLTTKKVFHVSPFFDIEGDYQFTFNPKSVVINYFDPKEQNYFFKSSLSELSRKDFNAKNLITVFFKYPLMSFLVMGRIHWQALRLFIKKATFYTRPNPPKHILSKEIHHD